MKNYTFEQIRSVVESKGYYLCPTPVFPKWEGRVKVLLTPEQARALIEYDSLVLKKVINEPNTIKADTHIKDGSWTPDMGEICLRSNFKVWKGMRILNAIASLDHPIEVVINVLKEGVFGTGLDNDIICSTIKNAVKGIFEENGKSLPDLDDSIWNSSLPSKLRNLDITVHSDDENIMNVELPTIVGVLAENRIGDYPDLLFIIRGDSQIGIAPSYPCNLMPSLSLYDVPLVLSPGIYEELFAPSSSFDGLIQANPATLRIPEIQNKKIVSYTDSQYNFMRISIPVQETNDGVIPVGAKFENDFIHESFFNDLNVSNINKSINYILLEEADFGV